MPPGSVSVVIPCYNAERWVAAAIASACAQGDVVGEIIVIDDGSTDESLALIRACGPAVRWETGPNRGGNAARNRGLALATCPYVQALDADDLLLPGKLAGQVAALTGSPAGIVYGDWRYQVHAPDGAVALGPIQRPGAVGDLVEALLRNWWVAPVAVLHRREVLRDVGGWDEALRVGQDRDLFLRLAEAGHAAAYVADGCLSLYRHAGRVSTSTADPTRFVRGHAAIVAAALARLGAAGRVTDAHQRAAARSVFELAIAFGAAIGAAEAEALLAQARAWDPALALNGHGAWRALARVVGLRRAAAAQHALRAHRDRLAGRAALF